MSGMDHYLLWRGPPMEPSPPACFASNQQGERRGGIEEDAE